MYRERRSRVPGAALWRSDLPAEIVRDGPAAPPPRVLPDGCMDIIWLDGVLVVAGPDTSAHLAGGRPGSTAVGLRFAPGTAPAVLGTPAHALRDQRVPLAELWPASLVAEISDAVAAADRRAPGAALDALVAREVRRRGPASPEPAALVRLARAGRPVLEVAAQTGWSERQLRRRSHDAFGYGLKTLSRVLRFQEAVAALREGASLADAAAASGYADQSHLSREVTDLAGVPPRELVPAV